MKKSSIVVLLLLLWFDKGNLLGCTVFMGRSGHSTFVASNEDYKRSPSQLFIIPSINGKYGHALFGYNGSVQSGMNEKGLFWDGLRAYPYEAIDTTTTKLDIGGAVLHKILEECATVDEVIELFEKYHWDGFCLSQLMVVDKTGQSAIITYSQNKLAVTRGEKSYQLCTNFRISDSSDLENFHWYNIGSGRFRKAEKQLQGQALTVERCFSVLQVTRQNNPFAKTIYSTVCELKAGDIHLSVDGDFSQVIELNLHEELKKGKHSYLLADLIRTPSQNRKTIEVHDDHLLTKQTDPILLDKDWQVTLNKRKAQYYRVIKKDSVSERYVMHDYFMTDTLQGVAYYLSLTPEIMDGNYREYHENGNVKTSGSFRYRLKDGKCAYWSKEGKLEKAIEYVDGIGH